jgi:hypothetical protein
VTTGERTRLTLGERLQSVAWGSAGRILFVTGTGGASAVGSKIALGNADGSGEGDAEPGLRRDRGRRRRRDPPALERR